MRLTRSAAAAAAAAGLVLACAASASAEPIDLGEAPGFVVGNTVWDLYPEPPVTVRNVWVYEEGTDPTAPGAEEHLLNAGSNDMWWAAFIGDDGSEYYAPGLEFDAATQANGDIVVTGPVEELEGLQVTMQFRFYAAGDLVRVLVTYTNPTTAPITVRTGTESTFLDGDSPAITATSTGDTTVSTADRWLVGHDGGEGAPVLTMVWQGPDAPLPADEVDEVGTEGFDLETAQDVTFAPGATVHFAYFTAVTGYGSSEEPPGPTPTPSPTSTAGAQATVVADDLAAAAASAASAASEFNSFSGRLIAGLPAGANVLNWGVVPTATPGTPAAPATPVVTAPAFTG